MYHQKNKSKAIAAAKSALSFNANDAKIESLGEGLLISIQSPYYLKKDQFIPSKKMAV